MDNVQLLQRYMAADEGAFREIVGQYKDSVYAFLRRFLGDRDLADDVFQETFLQLYLSRDKFDPSKPLRPWLFSIVADKAKDALRRGQRAHAANAENIFDTDENSVDGVLNTLDYDDHTPYEDLIRAETAAVVKQTVDRMPSMSREILLLAYFQKFSHAQMAEILRIPVGTVKSRLHDAVGRFAKDWNAVATQGTVN